MGIKIFPLSQPCSIILLRVVLAGIFMSHAITRIVLNTISQFGGFLGSKGIPMGNQIVWAITVFEIVGGILLLLGIFQKWISIGFIIMLLVGIGLIHIQLGWFNGEFGTGGCEYSVSLIAGLVVVAASKSNMPVYSSNGLEKNSASQQQMTAT